MRAGEVAQGALHAGEPDQVPHLAARIVRAVETGAGHAVASFGLAQSPGEQVPVGERAERQAFALVVARRGGERQQPSIVGPRFDRVRLRKEYPIQRQGAAHVRRVVECLGQREAFARRRFPRNHVIARDPGRGLAQTTFEKRVAFAGGPRETLHRGADCGGGIETSARNSESEV